MSEKLLDARARRARTALLTLAVAMVFVGVALVGTGCGQLNEQMRWPIGGQISQKAEFGHQGVDIFQASGSPVYATFQGTVIAVGFESGGAGNFINISHPGGWVSKYFHLSAQQVGVGQAVSQGQQIGLSGCTGNCTGPHLHFEFWNNGVVDTAWDDLYNINDVIEIPFPINYRFVGLIV